MADVYFDSLSLESLGLFYGPYTLDFHNNIEGKRPFRLAGRTGSEGATYCEGCILRWLAKAALVT